MAFGNDNPSSRITTHPIPAHGAHIFHGCPNIFFLTVCSQDRIPWMADASVKSTLESIWQNEATAWVVGFYLLMPDHLHLFCAPRDLRHTIDAWVKYWKSHFSRAHLGKAWEFQRHSFHHRIRNGQEYSEKWEYIRQNPVRRGFVTSPEHWRFQGEITQLIWTGS